MDAVIFHAVREHHCLLREAAVNLRAQRGFPGAAQREVEDHGAGGDHNKKRGQQLEKNPVLH